MRKAARMALRAGLLFSLVAMLLAGCTLPGGGPWVAPEEAKKTKNPLAVDAAVLAAGKQIYEAECLRCHGETGDGHGGQAPMYFVRPSDFTDAKKMAQTSDGELFWKIAKGRRPMPPFRGKLSEREIWEVVAYIRAFSQKPAAKSSGTGH